VIVTADIHWDLKTELRSCELTRSLNLSALVTCHTLYVVLTTWQSAVFLLNSRLTHFTATGSILSCTQKEKLQRSFDLQPPDIPAGSRLDVWNLVLGDLEFAPLCSAQNVAG